MGPEADSESEVDPPVDQPADPPKPSLVGRVFTIVLGIAVVAFVVVALWRNWDAVRDDLDQLTVADLALSTALGFVGVFGLWAAWYAVLAGLGERMPRHDSMVTFYAGQLGKYVPGSVWQAVIQAELGRRHHISRTKMYLTLALWMGILVAVGGLVSLLVLLEPEQEIATLWVVAAAVGGLVGLALLLHRKGFVRALAIISRRTGRSFELDPVESPYNWYSIGLSLLTWIVFGLHAWAIARPLGASAGDVAAVIGAFTLAWVVGVLAVPIPAGLGLREAVLVLTLGAVLGRPGAIALALVSRFELVVVDVVVAMAAGVPRAARMARRRGGRRPA